MTIAEALRVLKDAERRLGPDACLILSLTGSGIEDADVDGMTIVHDSDSRYVQVEVAHPSLKDTDS